MYEKIRQKPSIVMPLYETEREVCWEFNTALFGNKKSIINAVGVKNYQDKKSL